MKRLSGVISFFLYIILTFTTIPISIGWHNTIVLNQVHGILFFVMLLHIGRVVGKFKIHSLFERASTLCFPVFLFQHKIIMQVLECYDPLGYVAEVKMFLIITCFTLLCAKILSIVNLSVINSKLFRRLENVICSSWCININVQTSHKEVLLCSKASYSNNACTCWKKLYINTGRGK